MNAALARLRAFVWRFQTLPFAIRTFPQWSTPPIRERRFCGHRLTLDLPRSNTHLLLYLDGERVVPERRLLRSLLRPGDRVVDVGANIGYFLLLIEQKIGPRGSVLCLEPEPANRAELVRNIARNSLQNVDILPLAAGPFDAPARLSSGLNGVVRTDQGGDLAIDMRRLDTICTAPVDLLKIDVEGFELSVLRGAENLLAAQRPTVIVEVHPDLASVRHEIPEILERLRRHHRVRAYRVRPSVSALGKFAIRYLGASPIEEFADLDILLRECDDRTQNDPFWLVAHGVEAT